MPYNTTKLAKKLCLDILDELIAKYPDERKLELVREYVELPLAVVLPKPGPSVADAPGFNGNMPTPWVKDSVHAEQIVTAAIQVFREQIPNPVYVRDLTDAMRPLVSLPESNAIAAAKISGIFARRPDIFRKYPGAGVKATSRWHLVDCEAEPYVPEPADNSTN